MNKRFLKAVSLFVLFFFSLNLIFPLPSFAEAPRWNNSSIAYGKGGATGASAIQPADLNAKNRTYAAESVDVANGNYFYQNQDIFIPSRGLALELTRFYEGTFPRRISGESRDVPSSVPSGESRDVPSGTILMNSN